MLLASFNEGTVLKFALWFRTQSSIYEIQSSKRLREKVSFAQCIGTVRFVSKSNALGEKALQLSC